jgi:hypothetical protein
MLETMFQKPEAISPATFWCMTIDPKGVGAISEYDPQRNRWVTRQIFAPVDPEAILMWDEEE